MKKFNSLFLTTLFILTIFNLIPASADDLPPGCRFGDPTVVDGIKIYSIVCEQIPPSVPDSSNWNGIWSGGYNPSSSFNLPNNYGSSSYSGSLSPAYSNYNSNSGSSSSYGSFHGSSNWYQQSPLNPANDDYLAKRQAIEEMNYQQMQTQQNIRNIMQSNHARFNEPLTPQPTVNVQQELGYLAMTLESMKHDFQNKLIDSYKNQISKEEHAFSAQMQQYDQALNSLSEKTDEHILKQNFDLNPIELREVYANDGIVKKEFIANKDLKTLREKLPLKSNLNTPNGQRVRSVMSAALVSAPASNLPGAENASFALGGGALAFAADSAICDGHEAEAESLLRLATTTIDIGLGFIPLVSAANDATQIALGLATGKDYTGQEMRSMDYGLRAAGVVLAIIPVGGVLRYGSVIVDRAMEVGAKIIRGLESFAPFRKVVETNPSSINSAIRLTGALQPTTALEAAAVKTTTELVAQHFSVSKKGGEAAEDLAQLLYQNKRSHSQVRMAINSFTPGSIEKIELSAGTTLYRWHNGDAIVAQNGRFFTPDMIKEISTARNTLALPPENKLLYLDAFQSTKPVIAYKGTISPLGEMSGGGTQYFIAEGADAVVYVETLVKPQ